jgi:hypothetical protein
LVFSKGNRLPNVPQSRPEERRYVPEDP